MFRKGNMDVMQEKYEMERLKNWNESLDREKEGLNPASILPGRVSDIKPLFDDGDMFGGCRLDGTSRVTCAKGMDKGEGECLELWKKIERPKLPREPPGDPNFVKAVKEVYG